MNCVIKSRCYIRKKVRKYKEGVYIGNLVARSTGAQGRNRGYFGYCEYCGYCRHCGYRYGYCGYRYGYCGYRYGYWGYCYRYCGCCGQCGYCKLDIANV